VRPLPAPQPDPRPVLHRRGTGLSGRVRAPLRTAVRCRAGRRAAPGAAMPIIDIAVTSIDNFADGHAFGTAGPYLRIRGVARGTLDPAAPENAGIVDFDKAPRNADGLVEYATDFDLLRAEQPERG